MLSAGLAAEVQFSRYSSMLKPAVARSVCNRRVTPFRSDGASACPHFDVAFLRNLQILTREGQKYECMQRQLAQHPCKGLPARTCREAFVAALV